MSEESISSEHVQTLLSLLTSTAELGGIENLSSLHPSLNLAPYIKGLNATNEQQDNGTGVLHQVAQHPINEVLL